MLTSEFVLSRKVLIAVGGLVASVAALASVRSETEPQESLELAALMRAKLACSQKITEGLMTKDFAQIRKGSEELSKICLAKQWSSEQDQVYAHYRAELRRTAQKMILLAEEANLDGVAYTYMHSLTTCISCHNYCRDVLHIAADQPTLKAVPIPASNERLENGDLKRLRR